MSDSNESYDERSALVVDNGTLHVRAGSAAEDTPRTIIPCMISTPVNTYETNDTSKPILCHKYVMDHGIINSMNDMEIVWYHLFYNELKIDPSEQPVLLTSIALNPKSNKELMLQIMFETFQVPATYISNQCVLGLYSSGRTTGIVLSIGDGVTQIVPIWEGYAIHHAIRRRNFAGKEITNCLTNLLNMKTYSFYTSIEREIVRDLKEKYCYVALDYDTEVYMKQNNNYNDIEKEYKLPDGKIINVNEERFKCSELLFKPEMYNINSIGIHKLLYESITECDIDTRRDMYGNIVICGGTTFLNGFSKRLDYEMRNIANVGLKHMKIRIIAAQERKDSVWIGGSILASLSTFQQCWITNDMYDEYGVNILYKSGDIHYSAADKL
eukprot:450267_1